MEGLLRRRFSHESAIGEEYIETGYQGKNIHTVYSKKRHLECQREEIPSIYNICTTYMYI